MVVCLIFSTYLHGVVSPLTSPRRVFHSAKHTPRKRGGGGGREMRRHYMEREFFMSTCASRDQAYDFSVPLHIANTRVRTHLERVHRDVCQLPCVENNLALMQCPTSYPHPRQHPPQLHHQRLPSCSSPPSFSAAQPRSAALVYQSVLATVCPLLLTMRWRFRWLIRSMSTGCMGHHWTRWAEK